MSSKRSYRNVLTASVNGKGVIDVDTVKGCTDGMRAYPVAGCYANCYAARIARMRGFDFTRSIVRQVRHKRQLDEIVRAVKQSKLPFLRIGVMGDPSFDWGVTMSSAKLFVKSGLFVVIITKHWRIIPREELEGISPLVIFNTSISALDTQAERTRRLEQYDRIGQYTRSVLRVVTCDFNLDNKRGYQFNEIQDELLAQARVIDNPLRVPPSYSLVRAGVIHVERVGNQWVSLHDGKVFLGNCNECPELCGVNL